MGGCCLLTSRGKTYPNPRMILNVFLPVFGLDVSLLPVRGKPPSLTTVLGVL